MEGDGGNGRVLHFWRGARQRGRIWWGSLADKPRRRGLVSIREIVVFFLIGVGIVAALWLAAMLLG